MTQPSSNFSSFRLPPSVEAHNRDQSPETQLRREFQNPDPFAPVSGLVNNRPWCHTVCPTGEICPASPLFGRATSDGCVEVCTPGPFADPHTPAPVDAQKSVGGTRKPGLGDMRRMINVVRGK